MPRDELYQYSSKESERSERREKKRRPKMGVSGRSVFNLARIITERGKEKVSKVRKRSRKKPKR